MCQPLRLLSGGAGDGSASAAGAAGGRRRGHCDSPDEHLSGDGEPTTLLRRFVSRHCLPASHEQSAIVKFWCRLAPVEACLQLSRQPQRCSCFAPSRSTSIWVSSWAPASCSGSRDEMCCWPRMQMLEVRRIMHASDWRPADCALINFE